MTQPIKVKNCYQCFLEKNYHDCPHVENRQRASLITDGFMNVLQWKKYMTVEERQAVNDDLDSYIYGVVLSLKSNPTQTKK